MALLQSKRERFLMGLTALAVLFGGGYLLVFRPLAEKFRELDTQVKSTQADWEKTKDQFVRSRQIQAEFERIKASLSIEGTEQEKKVRISEELTGLLTGCGIIPSSRNENPEERIDEDFKIYSFSLKSINTDWPTLAAFLYQVETNPAVLEIKKLSVRRGRGAGITSDNAVQADVDISRLMEHKISSRSARHRR